MSKPPRNGLEALKAHPLAGKEDAASVPSVETSPVEVPSDEAKEKLDLRAERTQIRQALKTEEDSEVAKKYGNLRRILNEYAETRSLEKRENLINAYNEQYAEIHGGSGADSIELEERPTVPEETVKESKNALRDVVEQADKVKPTTRAESTPSDTSYFRKIESFDGLTKAVEGVPLFHEGKSGTKGVSHTSEDLKKYISEFRDGSRSLDQIPNVGGLRDKVAALVEHETSQAEPTQEVASIDTEEIPAAPKSKIEIATDAVSVERNEMKAAEDAYFSAYKDFHKRNNLMSRLLKHGFTAKDSVKLETLKRTYDRTRMKYAGKLEASAFERMDSRGDEKKQKSEELLKARYARLKDKAEKGKTDEEKAEMRNLLRDPNGKEMTEKEYVEHALINRYNSLVRFNEVVKPTAEKKIEARKEVLDEKGQNAFEKSLGWITKQNQVLEKRFGKAGAVAIRSLAVATVMSGAAAASGALGTVTLMGVVGFGGYKFGRSVIGAFAGTTAGVAAGEAYEKLIGRKAQKKAGEKLKTHGRSAGLNATQLHMVDAERERLISRTDEMTLQKKKALVTVLTAMGVGAGTAAALSELGSLQNGVGALEHVSGHVGVTADHAHANGEHPVQPQHPGQPHPNGTPAPKEVTDSLSVGEKVGNVNINDGDKLLGHFADKLQHHDNFQPGAHGNPPAIQKLFDELHTKNGASLFHGEDHAAVQMGFEGKNGLSAILHPGDKISFDHGQIVIDRPGHPELHQVLIDDKGTVHPLDAKLWHSGHTHVPAAHETHATHHHEARPTGHPHPHHTETQSIASNETAASILPAGMDPDSAQAADWLNAHHQPTGIEQAQPPAPEAHAVPADQGNNHGVVPSEAQPIPPEHTAEISQSNDEIQGPSYTHPENAIPSGTLTGVIHNQFGVEVRVNEPHLYSVTDAGTHETHLVAYGANNDPHFIEKIEDLAKQHPGEKIYFDSPTTFSDDNDVERSWVNVLYYDPKDGVNVGVTPPQGLLGVKLNPQTFTTEVE